MGAGSPGGSRRAISCDTVAATSSSVFATTAESPSKFTPCSSALGKTASAAASTAGSICLPCRSTELSRKELGDVPLAIVVHPEPVKDRRLVLWVVVCGHWRKTVLRGADDLRRRRRRSSRLRFCYPRSRTPKTKRRGQRWPDQAKGHVRFPGVLRISARWTERI